MDNRSGFNHQGGFSPIPRLQCHVFRSPSPGQLYGKENFATRRTSIFEEQSLPSPLYNSSPYYSVHNPPKRSMFSCPNAQQPSKNGNRSLNSSGGSSSVLSEESYNNSFVTPCSHRSQSSRSMSSFYGSFTTASGHNSNSFCSEVSLYGNSVTQRSLDSNSVSRLTQLRGYDTSPRFSSFTNWNSAESNSGRIRFRSSSLPQRLNYAPVPATAFRGKKRLRDESYSEYGLKSGNSERLSRSTNFKSDTRSSRDKLGSSDQRKRREYFRSPRPDESNPGHSSNIDDYIDPSMLEDPWKELMENLEEKQKLAENNSNNR